MASNTEKYSAIMLIIYQRINNSSKKLSLSISIRRSNVIVIKPILMPIIFERAEKHYLHSVTS